MTQTATEAYTTARETGGQNAACRAIMQSHGLTAPQAAEICWHVETGGPAPRWLDDEGRQTEASREWYRGAEQHDYEE